VPRPRAGPLAGSQAQRGPLGLPRRGRERDPDRPRRPAGDRVLPSRHEHAGQRPRRSPGTGRRASAGGRGSPSRPAPVPQRDPLAERSHSHQHHPSAPRPGRPGARVLGGHHVRRGGLALPDPGGRTPRPRRVPVYRDHHGGSRHAARARVAGNLR
jgi:hypothetical protein